MGDDEEVQYVVEYLDEPRETCKFLKRAGRARVKYSNGEQFEGEYNSLGQRHGYGVYTFKAGGEEEEEEEDEAKAKAKPQPKYEGNWQQGRKHGMGTMTFPNGDVYRGMWRRGKRHGQGTYTYANGDSYSGQWRDGKRNGRGTYIAKDTGSQLIGEWDAGKLSRGKWMLGDGTLFDGGFENNAPAGGGVFMFEHGAQFEGKFERPAGGDEDEEEEGEGGKAPQWQGDTIDEMVAPLAELSRAAPPQARPVPPSAVFESLVVDEVYVTGSSESKEEEEAGESKEGEWVVLKNTSSDPLQIRGASIRRQGAGITASYTFADEHELPGGGRVRVLSGPSAKNPPPEEGGLENVVWTHESIWSPDAVCELFYEDAEGVTKVVQTWGPDNRAQLGQRREEEEKAALAAAEAAKAEAGGEEGEEGE